MRPLKTTFCISLTLLLLITGCEKKEQAVLHERPAKEIRDIAIGRAILTEVDTIFSTSGTVRAVTRSTLTSKIVGNVTKVHVKEGSRINKGDLLIKIESHDISAKIGQAEGALESAKAALRNAESNFKRISNLFSRGSSTQFELDGATMQVDNAKGAVKQAEGAVKEARTMKQYAYIKAPISGVITRKMIEVGEQAAPGRPLLVLENSEGLQLETYVPESVFPKLEVGQDVGVKINALGGRVIPGTISEMEVTADPVSHSAKVKINIEKREGALSGMYGKALFATGKRKAILLPKNAVIKRGQLTAVYTVDSEKILHFRLIQTGKTFADQIEILSGLKGGERIALSKLDQIEDGMEVAE